MLPTKHWILLFNILTKAYIIQAEFFETLLLEIQRGEEACPWTYLHKLEFQEGEEACRWTYPHGLEIQGGKEAYPSTYPHKLEIQGLKDAYP